MSWEKEYLDKLRTADEALRCVESGIRVYIQPGCAEPETLVEALMRRGPEVYDVEIVHMMTVGCAPYVAPEMAGHFRHNAMFIGPNVRDAINDGRADYTPIYLGEIEQLFESGAMPIDVALLQLSPPDSHGFCSFGVFYDLYERKAELKLQTHYCPGRGHGIVHKLIAEALQEMGLQDSTIFVSPVGCSVFAYYYFDVGNVQVAHGRAPAAATGIKRACPDKMVISYQGDGDLAAIGTAEIVHAANRGEKITVVFVNNGIYGMTGGQMAPTTLVGEKSTTSPWGRRPDNEGYPLHVSELLATLEAPAYIERIALCDNKNIMRARRAIRKALEVQRDGLGFSFVEVLSPCPTIWGKEPVEARKWVLEKMVPVFPLSVFRDRLVQLPGSTAPAQRPPAEVLELGQEADASACRPAHLDKNLTINVAGFGGQGVLLLGQLLAETGMREGLEVSWLPSYGPEMRSGSAHCYVGLSKERIGTPLTDHPDVLIAMNELSLRKFVSQVPPGGGSCSSTAHTCLLAFLCQRHDCIASRK